MLVVVEVLILVFCSLSGSSSFTDRISNRKMAQSDQSALDQSRVPSWDSQSDRADELPTATPVAGIAGDAAGEDAPAPESEASVANSMAGDAGDRSIAASPCASARTPLREADGAPPAKAPRRALLLPQGMAAEEQRPALTLWGSRSPPGPSSSPPLEHGSSPVAASVGDLENANPNAPRPDEPRPDEPEPEAKSGALRTHPATVAEVVAVQALRGSVAQQLAYIASLAFPEPMVVSARHLSKIASLQRARREWSGQGQRAEQSHVAATSGTLADWNNRDPLSSEALDRHVVPLGEVAATGVPICFAALQHPHPSATLPPLGECPPRVTAALAGLAAEGSGGQGTRMPHVLLPSMAARASEPETRASASAAMLLYVECCSDILTYGPAPAEYGEALRCFEGVVVDLKAHQKALEDCAPFSLAGFRACASTVFRP